MRRVGRQEEELVLAYIQVAELIIAGKRLVHDPEKHGSFVLVEELRGCVYMVVCSCVGASHYLEGDRGYESDTQKFATGEDYHDGHVFVVDTVVVDRWFEKMGVLF